MAGKKPEEPSPWLADLLWLQRKNPDAHEKACIAASAYLDLYQQNISGKNDLEAIDYILRSIAIYAQLGDAEHRDHACEVVYQSLLAMGTEENDLDSLSIQLIKILVSRKYGNPDKLLIMLDKIISQSASNFGRIENAYKLKIQLLKNNKREQDAVLASVS